ncbi:hypothetical protein BH11BAC1_BH11BAC1_13500 [soil metagenome]
MNVPVYPRFVIVKDSFYDDPQKVYSEAMNASFYEPKYYTGFRSRNVYHEPGVKQKLEKILGIKITRWDTNPNDENGVFYMGFAKGQKKEIPGVHSDSPHEDITALVYLTPGLPFDCGTSLWMHKETKLTDPPTREDARRLKIKISDLRNKFEEETKQRSKWMEIDRIGYRFNRLVAYPSGALHSATNHFGATIKDVRLYQTFRIGVDWNSFRMKS